jgi:post-segregation antitoxin (ccd killing protein)
MGKDRLELSIDGELVRKAKAKKLNISSFLEGCLARHLSDNSVKIRQELALVEFLNHIDNNVIKRDNAMNYWASQTGLTPDELVKIKMLSPNRITPIYSRSRYAPTFQAEKTTRN